MNAENCGNSVHLAVMTFSSAMQQWAYQALSQLSAAIMKLLNPFQNAATKRKLPYTAALAPSCPVSLVKN